MSQLKKLHKLLSTKDQENLQLASQIIKKKLEKQNSVDREVIGLHMLLTATLPHLDSFNFQDTYEEVKKSLRIMTMESIDVENQSFGKLYKLCLTFSKSKEEYMFCHDIYLEHLQKVFESTLLFKFTENNAEGSNKY